MAIAFDLVEQLNSLQHNDNLQEKWDDTCRRIFGAEEWDRFRDAFVAAEGGKIQESLRSEAPPVRDEIALGDWYKLLHGHLQDDKEWDPPQAGSICAAIDNYNDE